MTTVAVHEQPVRLITIGPSHYCEKARWALERAQIPFVEEGHPALLHLPAVRRAGGRRTTPTLVDRGRAIDDSTAILRWLQLHPFATWKPYPEQPALRAEVEQLEDRFDEVLGPHVRRLAYYHLLPHRHWVTDAMGHRTSRREAWLFHLGFRPIRALMRRSMRIDDAGAGRSRVKIGEVLDEVDARLADGRAYLVGDRLTAADLTLAALGAPLVVPEAYGAPLPPFDELPEAARAELQAFRDRPSGQFILRLYDAERTL
jgi:glutathione S-transferase